MKTILQHIEFRQSKYAGLEIQTTQKPWLKTQTCINNRFLVEQNLINERKKSFKIVNSRNQDVLGFNFGLLKSPGEKDKLASIYDFLVEKNLMNERNKSG